MKPKEIKTLYGDKIKSMYENNESTHSIVKHLKDNYKIKTYPLAISRILRSLGVKMRDSSEAQKVALETGRGEHPVEGKEVSEKTKKKIARSIQEYWDSLNQTEKRKRVKKSCEVWSNLTKQKREEIRSLAYEALRETAKNGSRLEKFVLKFLKEQGYKPQFHSKTTIGNEKMELDIFVPSLGLAIEIDGPSHFLPIWGEKSLQKNIDADMRKNGLVIKNGLRMIRIKNMNDKVTQKVKDNVAELLPKAIKSKKKLMEIEV